MTGDIDVNIHRFVLSTKNVFANHISVLKSSLLHATRNHNKQVKQISEKQLYMFFLHMESGIKIIHLYIHVKGICKKKK